MVKFHKSRNDRGDLIESAVNAIIQAFYEDAIFDNYEKAEEVLKII